MTTPNPSSTDTDQGYSMADPNSASTEDTSPQIQFVRAYLKDASLEVPDPLPFFKSNWEPEINFNLQSKARHVEDNLFEVILSVTVTAKQQDRTAFLIEAQQAGLFALHHFDDRQTHYMLGAYCPNTLYPFAVGAISDMVSKAGFPQVLLAPINFDALYARHVSDTARAQETAGEGTH